MFSDDSDNDQIQRHAEPITIDQFRKERKSRKSRKSKTVEQDEQSENNIVEKLENMSETIVVQKKRGRPKGSVKVLPKNKEHLLPEPEIELNSVAQAPKEIPQVAQAPTPTPTQTSSTSDLVINEIKSYIDSLKAKNVTSLRERIQTQDKPQKQKKKKVVKYVYQEEEESNSEDEEEVYVPRKKVTKTRKNKKDISHEYHSHHIPNVSFF
jgi:hypothetical protein